MEIKNLIPSNVITELSNTDFAFLEDVLFRFNGLPSLSELWQILDEHWAKIGCDPNVMDERIEQFYEHPVWLLNGLFSEYDAESRSNRAEIANWVIRNCPSRIADFGGGFGGLARMISNREPGIVVEVVEPHPHRAALALAKNSPNVHYVPELTGNYDIIVATDVFEHVPDPLELFELTARTLKPKGLYFTANCFASVIKCHLPQLFHFRYAWDHALAALGMQPGERVCYGRCFQRVVSEFDLPAARRVARHGRWIRTAVQWLPRGGDRIGNTLMTLACGGSHS